MQIDKARWRYRTVVVSLAGLAFSLLLSLVVWIAGAIGLPGVAALERSGADLTMQTFTAYPWITDAPQSAAPGQRYVFVDIDTAACAAFASRADCRSGKQAPPALLLDFLRASRSSGAKVLLMDVLPPEDAAALQAYRQGLAMEAAQPGPWILVPIASRPDSAGRTLKEIADPDRALEPRFWNGRLRVVSISTSYDANAGDGVIRHYPLVTSVAEDGAAADRWLPTAPFLAAMLSDPGTASAADCTYYRPDACGRGASRKSERFQAYRRLGEADGLRNRIFYTLPAFSQFRGDTTAVNAGVYLGRYDRFSAHDLMVDGRFDIPPDTLSGAVVVVGSSVPEAEDLHVTPLGPMSGPEVILNATRAISEFAPIKTRPPGARPGLDELFEKFGSAVQGAVIFAPGWLLMFWLASRPQKAGTARRALRTTLMVAVFCGFMALALTVEFFTKVAGLRSNVEAGVLTDMLTPILALGLEGFAEAAKAISRILDRLVQGALEAVTKWGQALLAKGLPKGDQ